MNEANPQKLYADFPRLYRYRLDEMSMMKYGFDTNDGWFDLIYKLSANIEAEARKLGLDPNTDSWPAALQVKEKFGQLKFYCAIGEQESELQPEQRGALLSFRPMPNNAAIRALITEAEKQSLTICEGCGVPASLREEGWWRVTCDACKAERQARRIWDGSKYPSQPL